MSNSEIIFLLVWFSFFVIAAAIILGLSRSFQRKESAAWKALAQTTGLIMTPENLLNRAKVVGNYRNHNVQLTTFKRRPVHLVFSIKVNHQKFVNFVLEQQGFVSNVFKSKETQVKFNDKKFEQVFFIEGYPKDLVQNTFASESIRKRLMRITWRGQVKIKLGDNELRFEQPYPAMYEDLGDYLQHLLDLLIEVVEAVENQGASEREDLAMQSKKSV
jgi:hypothetical protein